MINTALDVAVLPAEVFEQLGIFVISVVGCFVLLLAVLAGLIIFFLRRNKKDKI